MLQAPRFGEGAADCFRHHGKTDACQSGAVDQTETRRGAAPPELNGALFVFGSPKDLRF